MHARDRISNALLCLVLVGAIGLFLGVVDAHYAVRDWLAWRYLGIAAAALVWAASCAAGGCFLLERLGIGRRADFDELVLAFPLGVLAFQLGMFVLGLAGLLGTATFFLLPLSFLLAGGERFSAALYRLVRRLATRPPVRSLWQLGVLLFGAVGVGLVYFQILSPESFSWDARWYHLPIAEQYALEGAVRRSPLGWWLSAYPHSASLLYAWAFLLPVGKQFDRLELCAHVEFAIFLATIASIPALVRALVPGLRGRGAWAVIFLFPGIFLYDGNLHAGADHIAALWCIPMGLALIRTWQSWRVRNGILFAAFVAGAMLSKYSAWSIVVLPATLFLLRAGWRLGGRYLGRARRRPVWGTLLGCGAAVLLLTAPHWLKNWLWYGDPVYPLLHAQLHVRPWSADAPFTLRAFQDLFFAPRPGWAGFRDALLATVNFSFRPNDWAAFHRDVPVFGSLFTLTLVCLPFLRARGRLWLGYAASMVAIVAWYLTNHQDRYLQTWLPAMAACTAAALALLWQRRHAAVRGLVVALVSVQVIWGADVPFFPTHNLINDSPIRLVSNLIASGFLHTKNRLGLYGAISDVRNELPGSANLLVHEEDKSLGVQVRTVPDQWQGILCYATLGSPARIYEELKRLEITHLLWQTGAASGYTSVASDLAFTGFALNYVEQQHSIGHFTVGRFPDHAPPSDFNDRVVALTCGELRQGIYRLTDLLEPERGQPRPPPEAPVGDVSAAIAGAGFLVVDPGCAPALPEEARAQFHSPVRRQGWQLYARKAKPDAEAAK